MTKNKSSATLLTILGGALVLLVLGALLFRNTTAANLAASPASTVAEPAATPANAWEALLQATPHAYFTPLPEPAPSVLDGTYTKVDQSWPQWWRCLRCADYRSAGGIWKLQFDQGVMRIYYDGNDWRSIASYAVAEDHLFIFNDPYCPEQTGEYRWSLVNGGLSLQTVNDPCAFDLRAENLTAQTWSSCTAGGASASTGSLPPGCVANPSPDPASVTVVAPLQVTVLGGDSRFFSTPPELIVHANANDITPPAGISVSFSEESIPYGLQRVLWWNGGWIEVISENADYDAIGVQFLGEGMIGWARVLFDGEEVWRGKTSEIWSKSGRHGGFVQVTGFEPGVHTLRVEVLGLDYRPVTVASFGFSANGGVKNEAP